MDRDGLITLTDTGMEIASKMLQRHKTLTAFLEALGVDPETAEEDACKMEHDISDQTFQAICEHARQHLGGGEPDGRWRVRRLLKKRKSHGIPDAACAGDAFHALTTAGAVYFRGGGEH